MRGDTDCSESCLLQSFHEILLCRNEDSHVELCVISSMRLLFVDIVWEVVEVSEHHLYSIWIVILKFDGSLGNRWV